MKHFFDLSHWSSQDQQHRHVPIEAFLSACDPAGNDSLTNNTQVDHAKAWPPIIIDQCKDAQVKYIEVWWHKRHNTKNENANIIKVKRNCLTLWHYFQNRTDLCAPHMVPEGYLASMLVEDVHPAFALCFQVRRSLRVEQGHHVRAQHPERPAVDRALRRDHHPEHQEQRLPLQTHLRQGGWKASPLQLHVGDGEAHSRVCCSLRGTTGAPTSTRSRDSWWTRKAKWSTGSLGNGTKASTAASRPLLNVSGGQVGNPSPPNTISFWENYLEMNNTCLEQLSYSLAPLLGRLHADRLRALLWLHQIRHRAERTLPRAEGRSAADRRPI